MAYKELATRKPFIVNKNLGSAVEVEPEELTRTTADGLDLSLFQPRSRNTILTAMVGS